MVKISLREIIFSAGNRPVVNFRVSKLCVRTGSNPNLAKNLSTPLHTFQKLFSDGRFRGIFTRTNKYDCDRLGQLPGKQRWAVDRAREER